eukprot:765228-Hanusia_phi.AAC.2
MSVGRNFWRSCSRTTRFPQSLSLRMPFSPPSRADGRQPSCSVTTSLTTLLADTSHDHKRLRRRSNLCCSRA